MAPIVDIYTRQVHDNLRPLYANWAPNAPVRLGDYGIVEGRYFRQMSNLEELDIKFAGRALDRTDHKYFASGGTTGVEFKAAAPVPVQGLPVKASLEIEFSSEDAVFFNAACCRYETIEDKVALGREIMDRYEADQWDADWAIVTDVVTAEATTIAVSGGRSASLVLEAEGSVPRIDLADAALGLGVRSARNVGYQLVSQPGLTPLIGLCQVQRRFWSEPEFRPRTRALPSARAASPDALFFGQRP